MNLTAEQKQQLYNLLKTAKTCTAGYVPAEYKSEPPVFEDDVLYEPVKEPVKANASADVKENSMAAGTTSSTEGTAPSPEKHETRTGVTQETLTAKMNSCRLCQKSESKCGTAEGTGPVRPQVLVITDTPDAEGQNGNPVSGSNQILLEKMLAAIGLDRNTNCFITSIIKCRSADMKKASMPEMEACKSYLDAQIHILKPYVILAMGEQTVQFLLKTNYRLDDLRGKVWSYRISGKENAPVIPLMGTYSARELLTAQEKKALAWADLKLFKSKLEGLKPVEK